MLQTASEVVDELGGTAKVAAMLGVGAPAVSNALKAKRFPYRWHMPIYQEAQRRGIAIAPELIGQKSGETVEAAE